MAVSHGLDLTCDKGLKLLVVLVQHDNLAIAVIEFGELIGRIVLSVAAVRKIKLPSEPAS